VKILLNIDKVMADMNVTSMPAFEL
jgi:hypothetical protein